MDLRKLVFACVCVVLSFARSFASSNNQPSPQCNIIRIDDLSDADKRVLLGHVERVYQNILGDNIVSTGLTSLPYQDRTYNPATGALFIEPKTAIAVAVIFKVLPVQALPLKDQVRAQMISYHFDWKGRQAHIARYMGASVEGENRKNLPPNYDLYMIAPLALELVSDANACKPRKGLPI